MVCNARALLLSGLAIAALPLCALADTTDLGTAGNFAVLAGETITNTGATVINGGDVGLSPGSSITGFGTATGGYTTHISDSVADVAKSDLTTAYNAAAGLAHTTVLTGTDLGGLTLTSGVYFFSSSAQLTGTLTLNYEGNANALFVFQIGSTLTTASNSSVLSINGGGTGCGIIWQVGSSATLGTGTAFEGHILALTSIDMGTGATLAGSALAQNGSVTLHANTITNHICTSGGGDVSVVPTPSSAALGLGLLPLLGWWLLRRRAVGRRDAA